MAKKSANTKLQSAFVGLSVDLHRVTEATRQKILPYLTVLKQDLGDAITSADIPGVSRTDWQRARTETLIKQTGKTIDSTYSSIGTRMTGEMIDLADYVHDASHSIFKDVFNVDILSTTMTKKDLEVIAEDTLIKGAPSSDWWEKQSADLQSRFASEIRMGVLQGETNDQLVQRIRGGFAGWRNMEIDNELKPVRSYEGGVMNVSTREAEALVRTSVQTISNEVLSQTYEDNQDVLKGRQFVATLDLRTTEICRAYDGAIFDFDDNPTPDSPVQLEFPGNPPLHWNCRSVLVPITKSWDELSGLKGIPEIGDSTRASMDGQVSDKLDYEDWLRGQSEERQIAVLGPGKYELWKDGGLTMQQMIDQQGNPLTIDELRAQMAADAPAPATPPPTPIGQATTFEEAEQQSKDLGIGEVAYAPYGTTPPDAAAMANMTSQEIQTAMKRVGETEDLWGKRIAIMNERLAQHNRVNSAINDFYQRFPDMVKPQIDRLFVTDASRGRATFAADLGPWDAKVVAPLPLSEQQKVDWAGAEKLSGKVWAATRPETWIEDVVRHEWGHLMTTKQVLSDWDIATAEIQALSAAETKAWWIDNVSTYSATNVYEQIAETLTKVSAPGYKKGTLPAKIEKVMYKMLGVKYP